MRQIFTIDLEVNNMEFPGADGNKFFGLGERKGEFYLADERRYSLFSNNNNLTSAS